MAGTTVCVGIMDEDNWTARTDILVVVESLRRRLTWVPRDLWCDLIDGRINQAFAGGQLLPALANLGFPCEGALCLRRGATVNWLATADVEVPVRKPLDFWYPLQPMLPIAEGRKQVSFRPPIERLTGERLHQWMGARYAVSGKGSDLYRCARQGTLLRALLQQGADFPALLDDPERYRIEGVNPLPALAEVKADWSMKVFDRVHPVTIRGASVLRKSSWPRYYVDGLRSFVSQHLRGTSPD